MTYPVPSRDPQMFGGLQVPQMPAALSFIGRAGLSVDTRDFQQPFRTWRAGSMLVAAGQNRVYKAAGSAIFAFDLRTNFVRLAAGEPLLSAEQYPIPCNRAGHPESFLRPDAYFYAENPASGWDTTPVGAVPNDGQDRLSAFDCDDRGIVYLATGYFGCGCVIDQSRSDGSLMQSLHQERGSEESNGNSIYVVKNADGRYFALMPTPTTTTVWDVTDPAIWTPQAPLPFPVGMISKLNDGRVAFVGGGGLVVCTIADLLSGRPIATPYGTASDRAVATDGVNLFVVGYKGGQAILTILQEVAGGFVESGPVIGSFQPAYVSVGGGFLAVGLFGDVKLYKIGQNLELGEVDLGGFLGAFYGMKPQPALLHAATLGPCYPIQVGTSVYLDVPAGPVEDVYLLAGDAPPLKPNPCPPMTTSNLEIVANGLLASGQTLHVGDQVGFTLGGSYPLSCDEKIIGIAWGVNVANGTVTAAPGPVIVSCTVTRSDGATVALSATMNVLDKPIQPTGCPPMDASNVFVALNGSANVQAINAGDVNQFSAERFPPYPADFSCAPHKFTWSTTDVGATISSTSTRGTTIKFSKSGTFIVQCLVDNGTQRFPAQMAATVVGGVQPSDPVPTITGYLPSSIVAGGSLFTLTVIGTNFKSTSRIAMNGVFRDSVVLSSTSIQCQVSAADVANPGEIIIGVGEMVDGKYVGADSRQSLAGNLVVARPQPTLADVLARVEAIEKRLTAGGL